MTPITQKYSEHHLPDEQGSLYVRDFEGDGPAFVLMHGFPDNLHIYDYLIPLLADAGRRVVTFDFLGFGASGKSSGGVYSFKQQLADLEKVVVGLSLDIIVPVGHDASGPAAVNFALKHPRRVDSLCLLNTFYAATPAIRLPELIQLFAIPGLKPLALALTQSPEQFGWLLKFQQKMFRDALPGDQRERFTTFLTPLLTESFLKEPTSGPAFVQMTAQLFEEVARNTSRLPEVEKLDIPVQIIWGEKDPYLGKEVAADFQSHFKKSSTHIIEAGHWPQIDRARPSRRSDVRMKQFSRNSMFAP